MFICNVFLTFFFKHKTFLKQSITNGFRTHHFLTFAKRFLSNVCKTQKCLLGTYKVHLQDNKDKVISQNSNMCQCDCPEQCEQAINLQSNFLVNQKELMFLWINMRGYYLHVVIEPLTYLFRLAYPPP